MPEPKPAIVIKVSLGDVFHLVRCVWWSARIPSRGRRLDSLRKCLWVMREERRRGTWQPWTIGDMVRLRRMRRYVSRWPREGARPWWRHAAQGERSHG